jgi:integrase
MIGSHTTTQPHPDDRPPSLAQPADPLPDGRHQVDPKRHEAERDQPAPEPRLGDLDPGTTKNDEGRLVYLTPELAQLLGEQLERIRVVERKTGRIIPFLLPYLRGRQRMGQARRDFRKAWATACQQAGVPGRLRHDFRRTAVRNIVNDGTSEKVAMLITGHKTRAVFDRYHIVAPEDLKAATARMAARDGHVPGAFARRRLTGEPQPPRITEGPA